MGKEEILLIEGYCDLYDIDYWPDYEFDRGIILKFRNRENRVDESKIVSRPGKVLSIDFVKRE